MSGTPIAPANASSDAYEVRCYRCDVAYPIGTKRCIHCGERVGVPRIMMQQIGGDPLADYGQPGEFSETSSAPVRPIDFEDEEETESRGSSMMRLLGNLSWVILFVAITVYRSCTE